MQERLSGVYDAMIIAHDTRKNLEDNIERLAPFELVVSTDTGDLLYRDEQGSLSGFFGGGGDINEQIKDLVDKNIVDIADHETRITANSQSVNNISSTLDGKLDKGSFTGSADDLNSRIIVNESSISSKLDKGSYTGTANDLLSKEGGTVTGTIDIGGVGSSRLVLNNMYFNEKYGTKQAMHFGEHYVALGNPTFGEIVASRSHTQGAGQDISEPLFKRDGSSYFIFHTGNSPISKATNGYSRFANGMIVQWGYTGVQGEVGVGNRTITFPIAFTSTAFQITYEINAPGSTLQDYMYSYTQREKTNTTSKFYMSYRRPDNTFTPGGVPDAVFWLAIGY